MSTSLPIPPSARDFQIYQRLLLDGHSTRQAAADFSLSQTRIRQIVQHVARWLAHNLPQSTEAEDAAYLRLAQHIAADRLQFLYGQAMQGWRATNQAKYAGVILRVTAALGKMPAMSGALDALIADALEGPLPEIPLAPGESAERSWAGEGIPAPPSELRAPSSAPPPPRDCSPNKAVQPSAANSKPVPAAITPSVPMNSSDLPSQKSAARRAFLAPAQPSGGTGALPASADSSASIAELKITPQTLGFTVKKQLSRRDRRRLRRLAAR